MGVPADRGPPVIVREFEAVSEERPSRDFRITEAHHVGQGSLHEKARGNVAAIRLLKSLEAENRDATDAEKAILARYAGWGAIPNTFNVFPPQEWKAVATEIKHLLNDKEFESARASTPNAHFTSPMVITAIWDGMQRLGLHDNAQILEPSMGVGHFFGLMPHPKFPGAMRTGVELDSVTARIAQKLYPDAAIFARGFEETPLPDHYFDAVVGNVPFGDYGVHDPAYKRPQTRAIHDYFFAKSIDKVRPGGVMALITSRYTMDKQDSGMRRYLADRADLIGAIRLPNTSFKANAGTEVTTDILFLQKRAPGQSPSGHAWEQLAAIDTPDGAIEVNEYYARHPQLMLGQMKLEGTMYKGAEPTLAGELTPALLASALASLPEGVYVPRDEGRGPPIATLPHHADFTGVKEGGFALRDGALFVRSGDTLAPANLTVSATARVRGLLAVRDAVRLVFRTQLEDASDEQILQARQSLNEGYGSYTRRFGPLSSKDNIRAFAGDPDLPLLLSLEHYDAETRTARKTAIFERRTLERYKPVGHVETAAEALTVSLNETGDICWPRMTELTGKSPRQLQRELDSLVYRNPEGGEWETADRYLSGDVRRKLTTASAASSLDASYARNVEALNAIQPADIAPGDISARLGSSWIPASDIRDFISETLDMTKSAIKVNHAGAIATWTVSIESYARDIVSNRTTHGTARFAATELIEQALNGRVPTAYDQLEDGSRVINQQETIVAREKQQQLKDSFSEWVWRDEDRAHRLARLYNDTFNNLRLRTFDGAHLTFPGMSREHLRNRDLDTHQKDAVWRILQTGNTLLAHTVGAGKTYEMTAAAMELRRMGLAKKPMFVVPNHLVDQWGAAFLQLYPHANILVAGKDSFSAGERQNAMSRIATGSYDAVIVSHSSFEKLPVSDETFLRFIGKQMDALEDAIRDATGENGDNRRIVKELEKAKKRLGTRIKDRANRERKDNAVTFEQLGIDQIFVDESDLYKNLSYVTKMNRIAGLPNSESNRALDMFIKTGYLREKNNGRGVVFATGTPISNTMAEMYTTQRYLAPEMLKAAGVEHFDAWAANFGEAVTSLELSPDGSGYRMHTRFAHFVNLPELLSMFRSFADVQTADMLNLPRPAVKGGKPHVISAPASDELKAYIGSLTQRAERLRTSRVDPKIDNMLKITGEGRKAALDMRLVEPHSNPHADTKLTRAIDRVYSVWEATAPDRATQLVFCDLSTPNPDRFNVYDEVREKLMGRGIPPQEIAFIHDAESDGAKAALFDAVNAGRVRILLGSTEKMGAGTNVQKRLKALHELDAPWRPRDLEQRRGRVERQGNMHPEVELYRYVTEGSFDAYMWQTLETKARFIQQVMNGSTTVRTAEDLENGALTYAEIKAIASGNPAVMEKVRVDTEIRKLDQLRSAHVNQQHNIRWELKSLPEKIKRSKDALERVTTDIATRDAHGDDEFAMTVGNRPYTGKGAREDAARALTHATLSWRDDMSLQPRARYRGFEIVSRGNPRERFDGETELPDLFIRGKDTYRAHLNAENPVGSMQSIEHTLRSLDRLAEEEKQQIARHEKAHADYHAQLGRAFEHEEKLKDLLTRQKLLNAALDLDKGERQVAQDSQEPDGRESRTLPPQEGTHAAQVVASRQHPEHAVCAEGLPSPAY